MSRVIVVGGGPAGLITLHYFKQAHRFFPGIRPFQVKLLEAEAEIGGTFKYRTYRSAELVSSKFLTPFSEWRISEDAPDFLSAEDYARYLEGFAEENKLAGDIECRTKVISVSRHWDDEQGCPEHVVTVEKTMRHSTDMGDDYADAGWHTVTVEYRCDVLVICTGLNVNPNIPQDVPGLEGDLLGSTTKPPFRVMHSAAFKNPEGTESEFWGRDTVVVLGAGETGHDIAQLAVTHPHVKRVIMCHRGGFFVAPKIVPWPLLLGRFGRRTVAEGPNKAIDTCTASLFDTAYVHPWLQRSPLLWEYYDKWIKAMFWVISGTTVGLDQWAGGLSWSRRHADSGKSVAFAVKTDKAIPYISAPFRGGRSWLWPLNWLRSNLLNVEIPKTDPNRVIELAPWPCRIDDGVMEFEDNGSRESRRLQDSNIKLGPVRPDLIILATGYRKSFPFLDDEYPSPKQAKFRGIYRDIQDGFAYIGFSRPAIGAIPPLVELQAQLFVLRWVQYQGTRISQPDPDSLREVRSRTFQYANSVAPYELDYAMHARGGCDFADTKGGVDHESYAYQMALDMGAAPTASHVLRAHGWKVFYTWAMGPNFNIKFRLVGPWAIPARAREVMQNELFSVVKRTGGIVFFTTFTLVPMVVFGIISLFLMAVTGLGQALGSILRRCGRANRNSSSL
ncbi:FAD/NAD(P)-binding domain-containing protein [Thozetella sp. PMI_491]|nr:FAD/NAD(P)-binding domain-containing protein [Thozetella sp. PMI_491]